MAGDKITNKAAPAKAPDNNKRLAALESGVAELAVALAANGLKLAEGEDPIVAAIGAIKSKATDVETIEALNVALGSAPSMLATALEAAGVKLEEGADPVLVAIEQIAKGPDTATDGENAAIARAERAELELKGALEDLDLANSAKNEQAAKLAELEEAFAALTNGKAKPGFLDRLFGRKGDGDEEEETIEAAAPRERPEHARDLGPTFCKLDTADFSALLESGASLEIAFSNGSYELVELAPVTVTAADLPLLGGRRVVNAPILIRGGKHREELHGAALLYNGEQVHYCEFPSPIAIEPGQERQFTKAIFFG